MLRIRKDELRQIEKVIKDAREQQVKFGGTALTRCGKKSDYYLIDENLYSFYLKRSVHYVKMYDLVNGEMVRVDGFGNVLSERDIRYFDRHIEQNKNK